jgi:hypothetical protein
MILFISCRDLPRELLNTVKPLEVRRYAIAEGWKRVEGVNGVIALYQHPRSDLDQLIVPLDPSSDDYATGMADLIVRRPVVPADRLCWSWKTC